MSETITAALAAVAAEVGVVRKDGRNQSQGFSYGDIRHPLYTLRHLV